MPTSWPTSVRSWIFSFFACYAIDWSSAGMTEDGFLSCLHKQQKSETWVIIHCHVWLRECVRMKARTKQPATTEKKSMWDPRTAKSVYIYTTPEDQELGPRCANYNAQCPRGRRARLRPPRWRRRTPLNRLTNEASPLSTRQEEAQPQSHAVSGRPIALLGQQTQETAPRTRGPFSARMDPGLNKVCLINCTLLRFRAFRTPQKTGFFDCQGLHENTNFPRIKEHVLRITRGSLFCGAPWSTKHSGY